MIINLYKNLSDPIEINKAKALIASTDAKLKDATSVRMPSLTLRLSEETLSEINYIEIPKFKRFYYIDNKISVAPNLWQIECSCDVLESFKEGIFNLTAIIERQENLYNLNQEDREFSVYANPILET